MVSTRHSEGPPFWRVCHFQPFPACDNLWLGIRLGLGSVVWLCQYQELFHATTMNDGFQNGGPFGMAALRNGGPEPKGYIYWRNHERLRWYDTNYHNRYTISSCKWNISNSYVYESHTNIYTHSQNCFKPCVLQPIAIFCDNMSILVLPP